MTKRNRIISNYKDFYNNLNENFSSYKDQEENEPTNKVRSFDNEDQNLNSIESALPNFIIEPSIDTNPIRYDISKSVDSKSPDYSIRIFNDGLIIVRYLSVGSINTSLKVYRKAKVRNLAGAIKLIKKIEAESDMDRLEREKIYDEEFNENNIFRRKSVPVFEVDYDDLEGLITKSLGQLFDIAAELELGHDDIYEVSARKGDQPENTEYYKDWIKSGRTNNGFSLISDIMNSLCDKGIIEEGDYIITVL